MTIVDKPLKSTPSPRISIGIPAYDEWFKLKRLLRNLEHQVTQLYFEVIVGDDAYPKANLAQLCHHQFPQVRAFRNSQNQGSAYTRNRIIECCHGEYIAFLDADCELPTNWLASLQPHLSPNILISGKVIRSDGSLEWGPRKRTWLGVSLACDIDQADVASSNNMVVSKAMAYQIGGFNEHLRIYFEDSLFSHQFAQCGGKICYLAEAQLIHHHHSLKNPRRLQLQSRNTLWAMYHVYHGHLVLRFACLLGLTVNYVFKAITALIRLQPKEALAYSCGIWQGYRMIHLQQWRQHWLKQS